MERLSQLEQIISEQRAETFIIENRQLFICIDCSGTGKRDGVSENEICVMCEGGGKI